ncbi:hypothetical protein CKF54_00065 [Psittacicella hinzii]|uniref:UvrC family homology region profile domain-containing protein n=1 Tax=Psittacicella hinzii TaxID=2028575 RepID=A0A3A1YEC8_9GAMM|nr:hypothetical protein [Psittacicella hinzii]RIY34554.1 hypothetical protein CKF54_00065 [Psittacicella hinzii]
MTDKSALQLYLTAEINLFNRLLPQVFLEQNGDKLLAQLVLENLSEQELDLKQLLEQKELLEALGQYWQEQELRSVASQGTSKATSQATILAKASYLASDEAEIASTNEDNLAFNEEDYSWELDEGEEFDASKVISTKFSKSQSNWDAFDYKEGVDYQELEAQNFDDFADSEQEVNGYDHLSSAQGLTSEEEKEQGLTSQAGEDDEFAFASWDKDFSLSAKGKELSAKAKEYLASLAPEERRKLQAQAERLLEQTLVSYAVKAQANSSSIFAGESATLASSADWHNLGQQAFGAKDWYKVAQPALHHLARDFFKQSQLVQAQEKYLSSCLDLVEEQLTELDEGKGLSELFPLVSYLEASQLQHNFTLAFAQGGNAKAQEASKYSFLSEDEITGNSWNNLSDLLGSNAILNKIHCFDISHDRGMFAKGSCVAANKEGVLAADYRHFNIEGITPGDDYAAMEQAVNKCYYKQLSLANMPLVILIDGGKQQIKVANKVLAPILYQLRAIEVFSTFVFAGRNIINHLVNKNQQLFPGLAANCLALNAGQALYQAYIKQTLPDNSSSLTRQFVSCAKLIKTYLASAQAQASESTTESNAESTTQSTALAYLLLQKQSEQVSKQVALGEQVSLTSFADLSLEEQDLTAHEFSWLDKLPLNLTVSKFKELIVYAYCFAEFLYPIKTIGVTKQDNRRYGAEKFIDGVSGIEIMLEPQSPELIHLLKLRDAAHNYANRKRQAKRDSGLVTGKEMLEAIPGLGATSIKRLYATFGNTGEIITQLRSSANPEVLLKELGIPKKAIENLLANLDDFPV